ncbi:hypothetical protein FDI40_gp359 [Agrobacterium phage Atu_ph07]|uniref:Uncharacterized protein n=1 Tax=Agrobacterium phage Atu_ph07 TaxID=2024264 RepID=A0A2L0V003_9CAUD|nr:hypothetical protein FDI40_gp359 [Agrobacterium phage Atu_ph07]AUZ95118.1 hypothetical protein [Agrobacterium phage Atu_ph07]
MSIDPSEWKHNIDFDVSVFGLMASIGYLEIRGMINIQLDTLEYGIYLDYKIMETRKTFGEALARVYKHAGF